MNATELLKNDHDKVKQLFEQIKTNGADKTSLFRQIKTELDIHAHIEETIFYPYLLKNGDEDLQSITREGIEEHGEVKTTLQELSVMSGESEDFETQLSGLMDDVEHHVEEEEGEMFPMVESQFDESVLDELGTAMEKEKTSLQRSGSASA